MTIDDFFKKVSRHDSPGDSHRSRQLISTIGNGLMAFAHLGMEIAGADHDEPTAANRPSLFASEQQRAQSRDFAAMAQTRLRMAESVERRARERRREDRELAEQQRKNAQAEADSRRRDKLAEKQMEEADSRIEQRKKMATANAGKQRQRSTSGAKPFKWVHPTNGRTYRIDRSSWDKSAHTLFQIIVDDTRPATDGRGYPSAEEWRRHCYDVYSGRDRRESYIMRNLPTSRKGMEYLEGLTAK